jgi:hypothetical protein
METAPRERIAVMTTIRKIAFAATVAAGLLVSTSAHAGDISSDRYLTRSQPQRHPAAAAVTAPVQEAKAEQDQAATAKVASAHQCACAHKS